MSSNARLCLAGLLLLTVAALTPDFYSIFVASPQQATIAARERTANAVITAHHGYGRNERPSYAFAVDGTGYRGGVTYGRLAVGQQVTVFSIRKIRRRMI
jgi:hypothetical protein